MPSKRARNQSAAQVVSFPDPGLPMYQTTANNNSRTIDNVNQFHVNLNNPMTNAYTSQSQSLSYSHPYWTNQDYESDILDSDYDFEEDIDKDFLEDNEESSSDEEDEVSVPSSAQSPNISQNNSPGQNETDYMRFVQSILRDDISIANSFLDEDNDNDEYVPDTCQEKEGDHDLDAEFLHVNKREVQDLVDGVWQTIVEDNKAVTDSNDPFQNQVPKDIYSDLPSHQSLPMAIGNPEMSFIDSDTNSKLSYKTPMDHMNAIREKSNALASSNKANEPMSRNRESVGPKVIGKYLTNSKATNSSDDFPIDNLR